MKLIKQYPILGSSSNPEKLSESVRGLLILISPMALRLFDVDMPEDSLIQFFDQGLIFWGMVVASFGMGRKLFYRGMEIYNIMFKK